MKLTKRRQDILGYIKSYIDDNGYPPAIREICSALAIKSPSTVHGHLKSLCELNLITMTEGKNRSIMLQGERNNHFCGVALVGTVAAGVPITAEENIEDYVPFDYTRLGGSSDDFFALRVSGDSMINAGIFDGDVIVVRKQSVCENGEIAVAMIEGEATVKRIYRENGRIRLQAENDDYPPMFFKEVTILGKVASLIRDFM